MAAERSERVERDDAWDAESYGRTWVLRVERIDARRARMRSSMLADLLVVGGSNLTEISRIFAVRSRTSSG